MLSIAVKTRFPHKVVRRVDEFRQDKGCVTRSEAIRQLVQLGLDHDPPRQPPDEDRPA